MTMTIEPASYALPAVQEMIGALQDYYRSLYGGPDRDPVDPAEFSPPGGRFFVGYTDTRPVAMGGWRWREPIAGLGAERPVEIKRMYVDPAARGRGYARELLNHLEATAAAEGADLIVLSTGPPQVSAVGLYRSSGYADVTKFGYYAKYDQAIHLGKRLGGTAPLEVNEPPPDGTAH